MVVTQSLPGREAGPNTPRIIGIIGKAGSGKDEAAKMLAARLNRGRRTLHGAPGPEWEIVSFAHALKRSAEGLLGLKPGDADDRVARSMMLPVPRCTLARFLQLYGDGMRRAIHADFWVDILFARFGQSSRWIISDVRYRTESAKIVSEGGILLRIERSSALLDGRDPNHASEIDLDGALFRHVIRNDGSLADLEREVGAFLSEIGLAG